MNDSLLQPLLKEIQAQLQQGRSDEARRLCEPLALSDSAAQQLAASQVFQQLGDFDAMLAAAERAVQLAPGDITAQTRVVESHIYRGRIDAACARLAAMEQAAQQDGRLLQHVASLYLHCARHDDAHRCYERAHTRQPDDPATLYNLASSCVAMGETARAEALYTRVITLRPGDHDAYQNRSTLRTWKADNHHLDELNATLARLPADHPGRVPLGYALAKEYEDLKEHERAFEALATAAQHRRSRLAYRVEHDVAAMRRIAEVFNADLLRRRALPVETEPSLFVLGLPRSGTTLVDRILSSHSQVKSLGEINAFAFALMQLASGPGGKLEMIDRSASLDFARLGGLYRTALESHGPAAPLLLNKTPANFLYLGLIHLALPGAKVVHLRRHPLDSCFAMFKTLFRMGYPFSYSLADLGHYYLAYHRLMQHWRDTVPDSFHDVDYEQLVEQQEAVSRALLRHCGLPWEAACLDFHQNATPAATASASQVRQPLYRSSVQRWRLYERQLAPLAEFLQANGIDCD
ncbi:MAG: sulfotransferase [Burkholderiaceae bacterium]|nr:sulfotransferase [Burkholderiaceae bacterium]